MYNQALTDAVYAYSVPGADTDCANGPHSSSMLSNPASLSFEPYNCSVVPQMMGEPEDQYNNYYINEGYENPRPSIDGGTERWTMVS